MEKTMTDNGKVFISHSHEDNERCTALLAALDAWQVDYWFDIQEMNAGQRFSDRIQQALGERDILIRVESQSARSSFWMDRELRAFRGMRDAFPKHPRRIIHFLLSANITLESLPHLEVAIDATQQNRIWLKALREALGITEKNKRLSRRSALIIGSSSIIALTASGVAGAVYLSSSNRSFVPSVPPVKQSPQPGSEHLRWRYRDSLAPLLNSDWQNTTADENGVYTMNKNGEIFAIRPDDGSLLWSASLDSFNAPAAIIESTNGILYLLGVSIGLNGDRQDLYLDRIDTTSGKALPRVIFDQSAPLTDGTEILSSRISSITIDNSSLYFQGKGKGFALSLNGTVKWVTPLLNSVNPRADNELQYASPIVESGIVYIGTGERYGSNSNLTFGKLFALNSTTGKVIWSAPTGSIITSKAAVANGVVYVAASDGTCYAFDANTGTLRWKTFMLPENIPLSAVSFQTGSPIVDNGIVYLEWGYKVSIFPGYTSYDLLVALNAIDGTILWKVQPSQIANLQENKPFPLIGRPLLINGTLYLTGALEVNSTSGIHTLYALSAKDGKLQWSYTANSRFSPFNELNNFLPTSPIRVNDKLYFANTDNTVFAFNL
jgi:outer membrane protein assembly factor BamB